MFGNNKIQKTSHKVYRVQKNYISTHTHEQKITDKSISRHEQSTAGQREEKQGTVLVEFSNSLIIHQVKTKKITTAKEVWIPGLI